MSALELEPVWHDEIYQLELTDPVQGGPPVVDGGGNPVSGVDNLQAKQLGDNCAYLKAIVEVNDVAGPTTVAAAGGAMGTLFSITPVVDRWYHLSIEIIRPVAGGQSFAHWETLFKHNGAGLVSSSSFAVADTLGIDLLPSASGSDVAVQAQMSVGAAVTNCQVRWRLLRAFGP